VPPAETPAEPNDAFASVSVSASSHYTVKGGAVGIQQEVYNHGPVEATFSVYEDFMLYSSGEWGVRVVVVIVPCVALAGATPSRCEPR
jgi:Papain family cysteine protease